MGKAFYIVDEDQLREKALALVPELRREIDRDADLIRELVSLEREKLGLDNPRGVAELWPNKDRQTETDPQWIGTGRIAGRHYLVSAWFKNHTLKIALLVRKSK